MQTSSFFIFFSSHKNSPYPRPYPSPPSSSLRGRHDYFCFNWQGFEQDCLQPIADNGKLILLLNLKHKVTNNLQRWTIEVNGAQGTLYANEMYLFQGDFPEQNPMKAPQQHPADNDLYMEDCKNGKSPKETRWWFHDDKV